MPLAAGEVKRGTGQRIPAMQLEGLVSNRVHAWLSDPALLLHSIQGEAISAVGQQRLIAAAARHANGWARQAPEQLRAIFRSVVARIQIHADRIEVALDPAAAISWLTDGASSRHSAQGEESNPCVLVIPAQLKRAGMEMRLVVEGSEVERIVDPGLTRILARAHAIRDRDASLKNLDLRCRRLDVAPAQPLRVPPMRSS